MSAGIDGVGAREDAARGVDVRRDARVDGAHELEAVLDGAEHGEREVLVRLGRAAEPGVVRDVDERVGRELGHAAREARQDVLVTDERAELEVAAAHAQRERAGLGAAAEVRGLGEELA